MACAKPGDCAPCNKCADAPSPVMPRCNVVLTDGSYPNATVVVEGGCIVSITQGDAPLYQPNVCCSGSGEGGGGAQGLQGPAGPAGHNATVHIDSVVSLAPGSAPTVVNIGTATDAALVIGIPAGTPGAAGAPPSGGASDSEAGIALVNGMIMSPLPITWPPVMNVQFSPAIVGLGIVGNISKDDSTGMVSIAMDFSAMIAGLQSQIDTLITQQGFDSTQLSDHELRITALEGP